MVGLFTVLAEQIVLPVSAILVLLPVGAIAGEGQANLILHTVLSVAACLLVIRAGSSSRARNAEPVMRILWSWMPASDARTTPS
jgi:hypothetical protein